MSNFFTDNDFHLDYEPNYENITDNEGVVRAAAELSQHNILAVDTENSGLNCRTDRPILLQVAHRDKCFIFHYYKGLDFSPLKEIIESDKIVKLLHNASYDWKFLKQKYGFDMDGVYCTMVAERIITVGKPGAKPFPSFNDLLYKYLGMRVDKSVRNSFINRDPAANPITKAEERYSANDTLALFEFYCQQIEQARRDGLIGALKVEFECLPAVALMEMSGVYIDTKKWRGMLKQNKKWMDEKEEQIYEFFQSVAIQDNLFGLPTFNLDSTQQLKKELSKLGFDLEDTNEGTLKKYKDKHPVFKLILDYRGFYKVNSTYGGKLLKKISRHTKRLHANFNQVRADSGRFSSSGPNLQNIPSYDPDDPYSLDFRSCFVPKTGYKFVVCDYSQQELRILADLSGDPVFRKAYTELDENGKNIDVHRQTASQMFSIPYDDIAKDSQERKYGKTLNFQLVYGGGAFALSEALGCSMDRAKKLISDYFSTYPKIRGFLNQEARNAVKRGFSTSISGRRRYYRLPDYEDPDYDRKIASVEREAKNNPMQAGGADVSKKGLACVYKKIKEQKLDAVPVLMVHDEIVLEVREDQAEQAKKVLEDGMLEGWDFYFKDIPMVVDACIADHWVK